MKRKKFTTENFAIALKWKTAHTAVKNTLGERFDITMAKTKVVLENQMQEHQQDVLTAVIWL